MLPPASITGVSQQPQLLRIFKKRRIAWNSDEGSIGRRKYGKVTIDCKLRLSESKWGVLDNARPAGILYIDLTCNQPNGCRLSSACIKVTLEEYEETPSTRGKNTLQTTITPSRLHLEKFGPTRLTGDPVTKNHQREFSLQPQVGIGGLADFGGVGPKWSRSGQYTSHWIIDGHTVATDDKKEKVPGIAYRTIQWDLTENALAFQQAIDRPNVIRTAFAFEHELKPFYIKVEIKGKLMDMTDRFATAIFPSSLKRNQGTTLTLVELVPSDAAHNQRLDEAANRLETQMFDLNLDPNPRGRIPTIHKRGEAEDGLSSPNACSPLIDTAQTQLDLDSIQLAKGVDKFAPSGDQNIFSGLDAALSPSSSPGESDPGLTEHLEQSSSPKGSSLESERDHKMVYTNEQLKMALHLLWGWFYFRLFQLLPYKTLGEDWGKTS